MLIGIEAQMLPVKALSAQDCFKNALSSSSRCSFHPAPRDAIPANARSKGSMLAAVERQHTALQRNQSYEGAQTPHVCLHLGWGAAECNASAVHVAAGKGVWNEREGESLDGDKHTRVWNEREHRWLATNTWKN